MQETNEQELDLMELIIILLQRWYVIAAALLVVISFTAIYAFTFQADVYTARSSVLVDVSADEQADSADILLAQRILDNYTEVAESNRVLSQLRENLDLTYTNTALRNMISVTRGRGDSIVLRFAVESQDPEEAAAIANELVILVQDYADQSSILRSMELLDIAETPVRPSGPNRLLYMAIGVVLGGMIGVFAVFAIEFFDKTIKTTKAIEQRLGLRMLGTIPEYDMDEEVEE